MRLRTYRSSRSPSPTPVDRMISHNVRVPRSKTKIMGIVNATPDSFSGDGLKDKAQAIRYAQKLIREGADIIDIGGESSRPGSHSVSAKEETQRVIPIILGLRHYRQIPLSVDTYKLSVAKAALDAGATMINNIHGTTQLEPSFLKMVSRYNATLVLMHMRGTPRTMQKLTHYDHLIHDLLRDLKNAIEKCLENGIKSDKLIIDPGIGFAKTVDQNLIIINQLQAFKKLGLPLLVGPSRKSFIAKTLHDESDRIRLAGTLASCVLAVRGGADILRVHDVKSVREAIVVTEAILSKNHL